MANILIASLGASPVVVPTMYRLLKKRRKIEIDEVHVLTPVDYRVQFSYDLVDEELKDECQPIKINLNFEDAHTDQNCLQFLKIITGILMMEQRKQNNVYLSLAGGRKSMAALMAWAVPLFPCVKELYHVIDPDEELFPSSLEDFFDHSELEQKRLMHPSEEKMKKLTLVKIPFKPEQQMSGNELARLLSLNEEDLEKFQVELAEAIRNTQRIVNGEKTLEVLITQPALDQYETFRGTDETHVRTIRTQYIKKLDSAAQLKPLIHGSAKSGSVTLHFCKSGHTDVRPVIYTQPTDIYSGKIKEVEKVIVCGFEIEREDRQEKYRSLEEIASDSHFSLKPVGPLHKFITLQKNTQKEDILLVPLGTRPMVVTQLYTLLTEREGKQIQEIVLFYPEDNRTICDGVDLLNTAIEEEEHLSNKNIRLKSVTISGDDIDSEDACVEYQQKLEEKIKQIQSKSPDKGILLSLSGGRKCMAAMTIFAASNMGLSHIYHTLITDERLSDKIDQETTIIKLNHPKIDEIERNNRLFLRSYDRSQFALFHVPVLPKGLLANN